MRKGIALLLAAALLAALQGCGAAIGPAVFTEEESLAMELVEPEADDWKLLEFALPEPADTAYFTIWRLEDGEWQTFHRSGGSWYGGVKDGRIAYRVDLERLTLEFSLQFDGGGGYSIEGPIELPGLEPGVGWGVSLLAVEEELALDEPCALLLISGGRGDSYTMYDPGVGFAQPELFGESFAGVYAFTVEFSND